MEEFVDSWSWTNFSSWLKNESGGAGESFPPFENELKTQKYFYLLKNVYSSGGLSDGIDLTDADDVASTSCEKSQVAREVGNAFYKKDKVAHAWEIYELYTSAMFIAPSGSAEVALAHANRAASLMVLELYQEAYDDCQCAIMYGYDKKNVPKLLIRQMHCASALKNKKLMAESLAKMRKYESGLNKDFKAQFLGFVEESKSLEELKPQAGVDGFTEKAQKICSSATKGRYVIADEDISAHEPIMSEKAFAFVPIFKSNDDKIHSQCVNCALELIIPFPCHECKQVSCCSLNCQREHEKFHKFECLGLRKGMLQDSGIGLLVLRTFLTGFEELQIAMKNEKFNSPEAIWKRIFQVSESKKLRYYDALQMVTNLDTMDTEKVIFCSFTSIGLMIPLINTNFFVQFGSKKSSCHWEIVVAALLMRHKAQMMCNAQKIYSIAPICQSDMFLKNNGRVRLGKLHLLSDVSVNMAFFPRIAEYSRSCEPNMYKKYNKSVCTALAGKSIAKGGEIFDYYGPSAKRYSFDVREKFPRNFYVHCKCGACVSAEDDDDKLEFVVWCCQVCDLVFTPPFDQPVENMQNVYCRQCGFNLCLDWIHYLCEIVSTGNVINKLKSILDVFARIDALTSGPNHKKIFIFREFLYWFIKEFDANPSTQLSPATWESLINFAEKWLEENEEHFGFSGLDYAKVLAIYLDLKTLNGRKLQNIEKVQNAVQFLPDRIRDLYAGYIDDYLKP